MALELSNNQTFFGELINDASFLNQLSNPKKKSGDNTGGKKTPRKSKTGKDQEKENRTTKQTAAKKEAPPRKTAKEPLKVLNVDRKTPRKTLSSKSLPPSPRKTKTTEKKQPPVPKIIVYKDKESRPRGQEKKEAGAKSREGRKSMPERSPKTSPGPRKTRHTINDFNNLKSPGKGYSLRLPKLKPEDPQFAEMLSKLEILFPGADPEFLKAQFLKFKTSLSETIEFILLKEKMDELPTRADYMRKLETEKLHEKFLESFSVENFLKTIPDPWDHFLKAERHNCVRYAAHSLHYLKNKFKKHYAQAIQEALVKNNYSLYLAHKELRKKNRALKMRATNRSKTECDAGKPLTFDIQFVHEVAFIENEKKIRAYMKKAEAHKQKLMQQALKEGTLLECQSCDELKLLPEDAVSCPGSHVFCKDCLVKYVEVEVEKNNFQFKCLIKCEEKFTLETLKAVLTPGLMAKIIKRNQMEEIKSAGIDDLVCCPFCYYIVIMPPEMSVLKCRNPCCLAETCRHCKQLNHIPLKCNELESFDETAPDENATASPLRCIRCSKEFVKSEDSNKMDCPCGATICSVCRQPFPECPHFSKPARESSAGLSSSSEATDYTETDETRAGSADSPLIKDNLHLLPSSSESF